MNSLRIILWVGALFLAGCQTPAETPAVARHAVASPGLAAPLPVGQGTRYTIRADLSAVRFLVFRAGALAALGHNHVVQAGTITGDIYRVQDFRRSSFSLTMPVADFRVDDPAARGEEGEAFASIPDADAISGTTRNMLGSKVLDAAHYPLIEIQSLAVSGPERAPDVTLGIRLHGVLREMVVPVAIDEQGDRLVIRAVFEVRQRDFGISPLSVLGGALQVADGVTVRLRIVAQKA